MVLKLSESENLRGRTGAGARIPISLNLFDDSRVDNTYAVTGLMQEECEGLAISAGHFQAREINQGGRRG
ncbi:MAG: hypothetical protein QOH25_30 [Acidobacteriota bacterium]|jgi:hypothetical protein|nr:hypothetical protein [Acidobacteriota bacterium]